MANEVPKQTLAELRKALAYHLGQFTKAVLSAECPRNEVIKRADKLSKFIKIYVRELRKQPDGLGDAHKDAKPPVILGADGGVYKP